MALLGVALWTLSGPVTVRHLEVGGVAHALPLPTPSVRVESGARHALFFVVGDRDLAVLLGEHAAASGWRYGEQLGSGHTLHKPGYRLSVDRRQWATSFFVLIRAEVVPLSSPP